MSEENQVANLNAAESTAVATPEAGNASTPDAANASQDQSKGNDGKTEPTPFHEHPRFKELISEKNQLRNQIAELQSQLTGLTSKKESPIDKVVQKYVKAGMKEDAARLLAEGQYQMGKEVVEERVAPIEQETLKSKSDILFSRFSETHKDYENVRPQMSEVYSSLTPQAQAWVSSDPEGLQYLYDRAKASNLDAEIKKAFEKGVQEGYRKKSDKTALTPSTGASTGNPKGDFSEEDIANMSTEEYMKNKKAIWASKGMRA